MTRPKPSEAPALLSTHAAAETLHQLVPGESAAYWRHVLINNRRNDREPAFRIPFTNVGRGAFYTQDQLAQFAEFEKSRRIGELKLTGNAAKVLRAYATRSPYGSSPGNRLNYSLSVITNNAGQRIQLITEEPLAIYWLTLDEATGLLDRLGAATAQLRGQYGAS